MNRKTLPLALPLALLLAGCSLFGSSGNDRDLDDARDRWDSLEWTDYDMEIMRSCFCAGAGTHEVWVRDDDVVAVWPAGEWPNEFAPVWWDEVPSIEDLFDLIDRANDEADDVTVEYDKAGWPSRIDIDWLSQAVDDEITYRLDWVREADPSKAVELSPGDTYTQAGTTLRFDAITADNRCPLSVECITAGEATASFTATFPGAVRTFELVDPPGSYGEDRSVDVGSLRVTLVTVNPYPQEPGTIEADAYTVRLLIETL